MNDAQEGVGYRFRDADTDEDGRLDKKEFLPFIHPFRHEHMFGHLVEDQLMLYDGDRDGMLSFDEFASMEGGREGGREGHQCHLMRLYCLPFVFASIY